MQEEGGLWGGGAGLDAVQGVVLLALKPESLPPESQWLSTKEMSRSGDKRGGFFSHFLAMRSCCLVFWTGDRNITQNGLISWPGLDSKGKLKTASHPPVLFLLPSWTLTANLQPRWPEHGAKPITFGQNGLNGCKSAVLTLWQNAEVCGFYSKRQLNCILNSKKKRYL